jgi:hypothetical protein
MVFFSKTFLVLLATALFLAQVKAIVLNADDARP